MRTNDRICSKVAEKYGGKILSKKEAQTIIPGGLYGWTELYGKYHPLEPTFFGLGQYLAWIVFVEPKVVKDLEKWAVEEFSKFKTFPVCYYSQPFDFGRSMFFRIFCFPDPKNQQLVGHIVNKYREMFEVAMKKYGGVPMRVKSGYPSLDLTGGYANVLTRIKNAFDPNNILSPNTKIFQEVIR